jgi:anti-anti-sigma factor
VDVHIARHQATDTTIVGLDGELDLDGVAVIDDTLTALDRSGVYRIVVDLSRVTFCDSIGLSALVIGYYRASAAGGYLRLAAPTPFLLRVLDVVGIRTTVPVYRSVAAACQGHPAEIMNNDPSGTFTRPNP